MKEFVEIGKIVKVRGLDGTLKVLSGFLPKDFDNLKTIKIDNTLYEIEKIAGKTGCLFVKLKNVNDIEEAENLKNKLVFAKHENINLRNQEYLIEDLIGMQVFTNENVFVGVLKSIENFGSKDVYTAVNEGKESTFCLIDGLIEKVDFENNIILLNSKILSGVIV